MISTEQNSEGLLGGGIQGIASQFGLAGNLDLGSNSESMYNKRVAMKILSSRDFTLDLISIPNSDKNFLQIEAAATLAAVSLALARSKTFLESL